ncbi:putative transporter [Colletotrichum shisoi]|uniref:Putative transporter n=1 Tax=Colletotrichum shisoi TaxID=2078593 RepID=A0A5Q4BNC2_9PEZI|nr:putative transporter [Colletotrichum shisoi]
MDTNDYNLGNTVFQISFLCAKLLLQITKAWWRPKGWFTENEEKILVNRILRDDPSKSDMHNRQAITPKLLLKSLADYELWPIYIFGLLWEIPAGPPDQ